MKFLRFALPAVAALLFAGAAHAQVPAGAPAGTTGLCNDGSYYTGATRAFSCRGHKGLKTWYGSATTPATPVPPAKTVPTAKPLPPTTPIASKAPSTPAPTPNVTPATAKAAKAPMQQAPGGGNGQVWVNVSTKVYHCQGDRYYGKTKDGKYMSEADAKAMGARADKNGTCK